MAGFLSPWATKTDKFSSHPVWIESRALYFGRIAWLGLRLICREWLSIDSLFFYLFCADSLVPSAHPHEFADLSVHLHRIADASGYLLRLSGPPAGRYELTGLSARLYGIAHASAHLTRPSSSSVRTPWPTANTCLLGLTGSPNCLCVTHCLFSSPVRSYWPCDELTGPPDRL